MPGLVRYWTFEEGCDDEVVNQAPTTVPPGGADRAATGGPRGSLFLARNTPYGLSRISWYEPEPGEGPEWTEGRFPGKAAVRCSSQSLSLMRSFLTGQELTNGMTLCVWVRPHAKAGVDLASGGTYGNVVLALGDQGWSSGFRLQMHYAKSCPNGELTWTIGSPERRPEAVVSLRAPAFETEVWHAVVLWSDGRRAKMCVDGVWTEAKDIPSGIVAGTGGKGGHQTMNSEGGQTQNLRFGVRRGDRNGNAFDLDECSVFSRALPAEEIVAALGPAAAGTRDEQRVESVRLETARARAQTIELTIPTAGGGYFRIGEPVPVWLTLPPSETATDGWRVKLHVETLKGKVLEDRSVPVSGRATPLTTVKLPQCGVYYIDLTLVDAKGEVVKRLSEPFCVGVVPPRPQKIDSPFGLWAFHDRFAFDTNLRRWGFRGWDRKSGKSWEEDNTLLFHRLALGAHGLGEDELRPYAFLTNPMEKDADAYLDHVIPLCRKLGIRELELTSEVDGHCPLDRYLPWLKKVYERFKAEIPDVKIYPPGATPLALPYIDGILRRGGTNYVVGVSHHNYLSNPVFQYHQANPGRKLKTICDNYRRPDGSPIEMYNTESGIFSLPRVHRRPMTRAHARHVYPIAMTGGYEFFTTSMPILPEEESAALQAHAILVNLGSGYKIYVKCQTCMEGGVPNLQGVALTTLSGQVLNGMEKVEEVPLGTMKSVCFLVTRKDGSRVAAVFGMEDAVFSFRVPPKTRFRTMDMLGNEGSLVSDADGRLVVSSGMNPTYVFGVPADLVAVTPLKLAVPEVVPENGVLKGTLTVENCFAAPLAGTLAAVEMRGATVGLSQTDVALAPGEKKVIDVTLTATALKHRRYPLRVELCKDGACVASAEVAFESRGVVQVVPPFKCKAVLGDAAKWADVPEAVCDTADDVVHGKPNFAELWLPQWRGEKDFSMKVKVAYAKDDAVYFRLEAKDDVLLPAPEEKKDLPFFYDCLELFVDSRTGKTLGAPKDDGTDQVMVSPSVSGGPAWVKHCSGEASCVTVEAVSERTSDGYVLEGRIVPTAKSPLKIRPGTRLLLDFLVDDTDKETEKRKSAMALHGTFNNYANVSGWGRYELGL